VSEWTALIPVIMEISAPLPSVQGGNLDGFEERAMMAGTPAKRLPVKGEKSFSPLDLLIADLPSSASDQFGVSVLKNFKSVGDAVNLLNVDVSQLKNTAVDHLQAFNCLVDRLNNLQTSVGQHPKTATLPSLWMAVSDLSEAQDGVPLPVARQLEQHSAEMQSLQKELILLSDQVQQSRADVVSAKDLRDLESQINNVFQGIEPFLLRQIQNSEQRVTTAMDGLLKGDVEVLLMRAQIFFTHELPHLQSHFTGQNSSLGMPPSSSSGSGLDEIRLAIDKLAATQADQGARLLEVEVGTED
jgi:hypothetical protein